MFALSKLRVILLFVGVLFCIQIFAAEPAVMSLIRKKYTANASIDAQFELNTYWSVREKDEKKSGRLLLAPGNCFNVELGSEIFVSDGKIFWLYNQKVAQVVLRNLSDMGEDTPSRLLTTFLSSYTYTEKGNSNGLTTLQWTAEPGSKSEHTSIEVGALTKSGEVKTLKITDRNGNIQTYSFKKTVFNAKIPAKVFTFEVPNNVQVFDNR